MTITLAFYKGRAKSRWHRLQDWAIRWRTRLDKFSLRMADYSHVELIEGSAKHGETHLCLSASGRDGGVREKHIFLKSESWDLVELNINADDVAAFIRERSGAGYDYRGILCSQVFRLGLHDESLWFCSEIIAASLDLPNPQRVSPQFLFDVLTWDRQAER